MIIGLAWAVWHVWLFLMDNTSQSSMPVLWFTVEAVALSIILTWAYDGSGGSLLLAVLAHGALNAGYQAAIRWLAPDTLTTFMP